jgi:hypothetical protein
MTVGHMAQDRVDARGIRAKSDSTGGAQVRCRLSRPPPESMGLLVHGSSALSQSDLLSARSGRSAIFAIQGRLSRGTASPLPGSASARDRAAARCAPFTGSKSRAGRRSGAVGWSESEGLTLALGAVDQRSTAPRCGPSLYAGRVRWWLGTSRTDSTAPGPAVSAESDGLSRSCKEHRSLPGYGESIHPGQERRRKARRRPSRGGHARSRALVRGIGDK